MDVNIQIPVKPAVDLKTDSTPLLRTTMPPKRGMPQPHFSQLSGYLFLLLSAFGSAGVTLFSRLAEDRYNFPVLPAIFIRGIIMSTIGSTYIAIYVPFQEISGMNAKKWIVLLVRAMCGALSTIFFFSALEKIYAGEAITVFALSPIITMLLSALLLGEPIAITDIIALVLSFAGVCLIVNPESNLHNMPIPTWDRVLGCAFAFGSAVCSSVGYIAVRNLGTSVNFMVIVVAVTLVSSVITVPFGGAIGPQEFFSNTEVALTVSLASLSSFVEQVSINIGLQVCPAGKGVLIRNIDVPTVFVLGIVFLGEVPSLISFIGSFLVVFSVLILGVSEMNRR